MKQKNKKFLRRLICLLFLLFVPLSTLQGCRSRKPNYNYHIEQDDGKWYLVFEDAESIPRRAPDDSHLYLVFSLEAPSIATLREKIVDHQLTEAEILKLARDHLHKRILVDGKTEEVTLDRIELFDLEHLYLPVLPSGVVMGATVTWLGTSSYTYFDCPATSVCGRVSLTVIPKDHIQDSIDLHVERLSKSYEAKRGDLASTEYWGTDQAGSEQKWAATYTLQNDKKTVFVVEQYAYNEQQADTVLHSVTLYGQEREIGYRAEIYENERFAFAERPTEEWLLSFGVSS